MTDSTISDRVGEMHAMREGRPPNEATAVFDRERTELAFAGLPAGIAGIGTTLADAELLDVDAVPTTLYAATADRRSVVVFYRGVWCPYCNIALSHYQSLLLPALTERGVRLIAISPQRPDGSLSMREKHDLGYAVLSDPGNTVARRLGILTRPSAEARAAQLKLGLDLAAVNADGTIDLPLPTTLVVDPDHTLRWIDVHPDYTTRTEVQQILDAVDQLDR
jgi:peroxiredoxin